MKTKPTLWMVALLTVLIYSCDDSEFNDSNLLSELDLLNQKVDSLAQVNNNLIDSLGDVTEDLDNSLDIIDGFAGPINMTAIGNWDDDDSTAFSLNRNFGILGGDRFNEMYIIDRGRGILFISVTLQAESLNGSSEASFSFTLDTNQAELTVTDFISSSEGNYSVNAFSSSRYFSQQGFLNNGSNPDNITIDSFNFNQNTLGLSLVFTVNGTEEEPFNSVDNPTTVRYVFNDFLVWGSTLALTL